MIPVHELTKTRIHSQTHQGRRPQQITTGLLLLILLLIRDHLRDHPTLSFCRAAPFRLKFLPSIYSCEQRSNGSFLSMLKFKRSCSSALNAKLTAGGTSGNASDRKVTFLTAEMSQVLHILLYLLYNKNIVSLSWKTRHWSPKSSGYIWFLFQ